MAVTAKANNSNEGWGMGFCLVFFPEVDESIDISNQNKTNLFSSSSSSSSSSSTIFKSRANSNHLLSRAQSTISICALLISITLLVFTLSTFEPAATHFTSRRQLSSSPPFPNKPIKTSSHSPPSGFWFFNIFSQNSHSNPEIYPKTSRALQGMGTLYRRGTKSMNDLIVGHVIESLTPQELRLFLRLFHRSGLTSRSDLVFILPSSSSSSSSHLAEFENVILEENESFTKLVKRSQELNSSTSLDATRFMKSREKGREWGGEPIWGRRIRMSNYSEEGEDELTRLSYGSVVGFVVDELDPENSLSGFLDHVQMSLRRWACYPMLLGRVRKNFKHVILVDVKEVWLLGDPLGPIRTRGPETVWLSTESTSPNKQHGRKNSEKTRSHGEKPVNSAAVMGGARGVRRLSNAMLTEIVRAATQHRRKNSVTESGLFNELVRNEFVLKNANVVVVLTGSIPDASSLTELSSNSGSFLSLSNYTLLRRGNSNIDITSIAMKQLCSLDLDISVYNDC